MRPFHRILPAIALVLGGTLTAVAILPATAQAAPSPRHAVIQAPERTAISVSTPAGRFATPNAHQSRPALSLIKLFMADWVVNRGDGSHQDLLWCELMIRQSNNAAATALWDKYGPITVTSPAAFYGLSATRPGDSWGASWTSAADVTTFLDAKRHDDPSSPVLLWMRQATTDAADGTHQDWGTFRYTDVFGTKWGWSEYGPSTVGSASFGRGFSIAAITFDTSAAHTADLLQAVPDVPSPLAGTASLADFTQLIPAPIGVPLQQSVDSLLSGIPAGS